MLEHPNHVLAISTVRMPSIHKVDGPVGPIVCLATFSVERIGDTEARFASTRVTFEPDGDWRAPAAHVRCLLHRHTYAIGCRPSSDKHRTKYLRHRRRSYEELPGTAELPSLRRHVIRAREKTLAGLGRDHGLMVSDRPPHLAQATRKAADRAQAVWVTALGIVRDRDERAHLYAAWEAWRVLERARPLPF
ncbi:hypothetical protein [Novosphingopyxis sp. YJ-S2-01]|uniref:hypothetical protein n=1 Tax=Novosphingopyxis sp. YJ-S2-01 TaxID=2794021 RepID=UPI0018DE3609|nr:hypothetical protein [Novosphingopyxis sp. YJ-S2-01]MBH9537059.1 hypothetical protein [Novosphingopyxis sp. YJ-S2-01]